MRGSGAVVAVATGAVLLVVLVLALGYLLLASCAVRTATGWLDACPPVPANVSGALAHESQRTFVLQDRVARLERAVAGVGHCTPPEPWEEVADAGELPRDDSVPFPEPVETPPPQEEPEEPQPPPPEEPEEPQPPPPEEPEEPQPPPPEDTPPPEEDFDERLEEQEGEVSEELTVTLIWDDRSDLDLEVHCPGGGTAGVRGTGCGGGILDVDANGYGAGGLMMMDRPVENVRFGAAAPAGEYRIRIYIAESYEDNVGDDRTRNTGHHPFRVRVISRGTERIFEDVHPGLGGGDVWLSFTH